jgi:hypothetical protein
MRKWMRMQRESVKMLRKARLVHFAGLIDEYPGGL